MSQSQLGRTKQKLAILTVHVINIVVINVQQQELDTICITKWDISQNSTLKIKTILRM